MLNQASRSLACPHWASRLFAALAAVIFLCALQPAAVSADSAAAGRGTIEGRVFNPATGEYLENARVTVEGTALETLTDNLGQYSFANVPAGAAKVKRFLHRPRRANRVGQRHRRQTVQQDFNLERFEQKPAGRRRRQASKFVVSTSREMDGAAIAINEKRFAADIRNVIAADEFGPMADGNVGELLKTVPGVAIDYVGGAAMNISLNGVPSGYVPVTMNGFPLASTTATGAHRRATPS